MIESARGGVDDRQFVAQQLDFMVAEALIERPDHALLAMGRSTSPGCFCSVNKLLRDSIDVLCGAFAMTLIDAEAGVEQINREVTRRTSGFVVVLDGSERAAHTLRTIRAMAPTDRVAAVMNRHAGDALAPLELEQVPVLGVLPEDELLRRQDQAGRSLWDLPTSARSRRAADAIAHQVIERWAQPSGASHA